MESLFVLWRLTGKAHFREWAWTMFRAFQMHARVPNGGYANLDSCLEVGQTILLPHSHVPSRLARIFAARI